ncbi:MAG: hypothetical protein O2999_13280 [Nitrospirae bacterium]|nr:hypothetical protein [Nitrospirota bacterium]MDA1305246.1 hypothetical protein [Nitrospirota bacterium]
MLASTKKRPHQQETPTWMGSSSSARLWLSFWPQHEPAIHRLKLTNLKIHPFGLQFPTDRELAPGTPVELRILLPPMTAIALKGSVTITEASLNKFLTSIRFTMIRDSDRKRLADFTAHRRMVRLRARCSPANDATATAAGIS